MNILVTGGASGLGRSITMELAKNENNLIYFTFNQSQEGAREIEKQYSNTIGLQCDFNEVESVDALLSSIEKRDIQILINNAFTGLQTNYFHKTDAQYFVDSFSKNILPVIKITQKAILHFRKQKFGKIITILSSYIINKPPIGLSEYVAEKNYLLSLSKSWATENAKFNVTSNCISPSMMQTQLTADTDERVMEEIINTHPLKKILNPSEVAETVHYFVNCSQQINGTNFVINAASDLA